MKKIIIFLIAGLIFMTNIIFGQNPSNAPFGSGPFLLDTSVVYISTEGSSPAVASDGTNFLAVWDDSKRAAIYGSRITGDGVLLDAGGFEIAPGDYPCLAYNGSVFLVVWEMSGNSKDIYAARVTSDGQLLDPNGITICTAAGNQRNAKVTSNGSDWLICWEDERNGNVNTKDIYGARVNASGQVLDSDGFPISTAPNRQESVSMVFGGSNYFVIWDDSRNSDSIDVYGARIELSGNVLDPNGILICSEAISQYAPSVSFDGTNYFVVWSDDRLNLWYTDIYGTRVNQSGIVLDPSGIPLFNGSHWEEYTALQFDGTNYLITWEDYRTGHADIYGGRVTPSGAVLDPGGFPICTAGEEQYNNNCTLAFNGNCYLSIWEDERNNPSSAWHIYGARINTTGTVLDPNNFCISLKANEQFTPAAVFDGTNYFAVWEETKSGTSDIYGAKYNSSGEILSPGIIAICTAAYDQKRPAVVFDGANYFVVWQDNRASGSNYGIYAARVDQSGNVLDPNSIAIHWAGYSKEYPDVAFDGTNFLIVHQSYRSGYNREIYGIRVSPAGTILDPGGFDISLSQEDEYYPKIAFNGINYLVVWADKRNQNKFNIYGSRVDTSGSVMDSTGIGIRTEGISQLCPAIAYDGNNYLVVWEEYLSTSGQETNIFGTRINTNGVVLDPNAIEISTLTACQRWPKAAFDGTRYMVVWEYYELNDFQNCDIYGACVSTSGTLTNSFFVSNEAKKQINPSIVHGADDQFLIVYDGWCNNYNGTNFNTTRTWGKIIDDVTSIPEQDLLNSVPASYRLYQNYPNPFNPSTKISWQAPVGSWLTLKVYDVLGNLVTTLVDEYKPAGTYEVEFNPSSINHPTSSGVYFYQLKSGEFLQTKKMLLIK